MRVKKALDLRGSFSIGRYYKAPDASLLLGEAVYDAGSYYESPLLGGIIATP